MCFLLPIDLVDDRVVCKNESTCGNPPFLAWLAQLEFFLPLSSVLAFIRSSLCLGKRIHNVLIIPSVHRLFRLSSNCCSPHLVQFATYFFPSRFFRFSTFFFFLILLSSSLFFYFVRFHSCLPPPHLLASFCAYLYVRDEDERKKLRKGVDERLKRPLPSIKNAFLSAGRGRGGW